MKINEIWNEIENDKSLANGLLLRRYSAEVNPDIYVALRQPENVRCLAIRLSGESNPDLSLYSDLKDIDLEIIPDEKNAPAFYLLIVLKTKQHDDVFATLCEDLINRIKAFTIEKIMLKELFIRLEKWKSLFSKASQSGLSMSEQLGLYGELYFLKKLILSGTSAIRGITSWIGPEKQPKDFQLEDWAVEVKTSAGKNHQKIQISSERQLDTSNLSNLFLFHLSLEGQQQNGETLNEIIQSLNTILDQDSYSRNLLSVKLLEAGYFSYHSGLYESIGYRIRKETYYKVKDNFPRIVERDLRNGVGDVQYTIILSDYSTYVVNENFVFDLIK
ncbi:MAG: PD-(D/E)XK motif protein [Bacteroidota bacterium]|nr:PD-(D/E)XK motif protein [Bacteroidota bacterium]